MLQEYFTTIEAAGYLRVSRQYLEILRHEGGGPEYLQPIPKGAVRYRRADLDAWIETGRRRNTSERQSA